MNTFYYKVETYNIRGAIFAVHNELGNGFFRAGVSGCLGV